VLIEEGNMSTGVGSSGATHQRGLLFPLDAASKETPVLETVISAFSPDPICGLCPAEVYSAATTCDQAKIVWGTAHKMVQKSPGFRQRFGIDALSHSIAIEREAAFFKPLSHWNGPLASRAWKL
jgi:hypothetical protein